MLHPALCLSQLTVCIVGPPAPPRPQCGLSVSEGSTAEWKRKNQPDPPFLDGGDSFVLRSACASGKVAMVRYVLEKGVDVNHADPINGGTPLECGCASGNRDIVRLLVEAGASINTPARHCR